MVIVYGKQLFFSLIVKSASAGHPGYFLTLTSKVSSSKFKFLQEKNENRRFLSVTQWIYCVFLD